jgi:hypothetical protein
MTNPQITQTKQIRSRAEHALEVGVQSVPSARSPGHHPLFSRNLRNLRIRIQGLAANTDFVG